MGARFALEFMCVLRNVVVCHSGHSRVRQLRVMSPRVGHANANEWMKEGRDGGD